MNSDKAAAVRDSVNGCPQVIDPDDAVVERDGEPYERRGETKTGDRLDPGGATYKPASIQETGEVGDGNGATRPVYAVVLESLWTEPDDVRSLSPELVYEIAKHDCRVRFYPPDHRLSGDIWIVDHFTEDLSNSDGDRCPQCDSTYFKIRNGTAECAKCGATAESEQIELTEAVAGGGR